MIKTDLSIFNNKWYSPKANLLKRIAWYFVNAAFFMNPIFAFNGLKVFFLKRFGAKVGKGVIIKPSVNIKYPWMLSIGNNTWIGERVWIDNLAQVHIGNNVCISQGAFLLCGNHNYKKVAFDLEVGEIIVEDGVWIGAMAVVCPGVTCYSHAVLSVGSVATANLEKYSIYQGNPAVKVRERIFEKVN
jgi:putative colanic acid biosynthesis acetyltransferase WcaF